MFLSEGISTPWKINMNIQITHLERNMIFQTSMIMFHVNLPGCIADVTAFVTSAFLQQNMRSRSHTRQEVTTRLLNHEVLKEIRTGKLPKDQATQLLKNLGRNATHPKLKWWIIHDFMIFHVTLQQPWAPRMLLHEQYFVCNSDLRTWVEWGRRFPNVLLAASLGGHWRWAARGFQRSKGTRSSWNSFEMVRTEKWKLTHFSHDNCNI